LARGVDPGGALCPSAAVWVVVARAVVPPVVRAATTARACRSLNRVFQRRIRIRSSTTSPLADVLAALLLGGLFHLVVVLVIGATNHGMVGSERRRPSAGCGCSIAG